MSDAKREVRLAIVGVGNCAWSLLQGLSYYGAADGADGMITPRIGGYGAGDVRVVAAFDVTRDKVGQDVSVAVHEAPNDTLQFADVPWADVVVQRGPTLDGLGQYLMDRVEVSTDTPVDVAAALRAAGATVVVNYLPVGSEAAARYYAQAAIDAGCAFVNCMPTFIASDPVWAAKFSAAGLPIIGDDVKSQVGATIVHRALAQLMHERGVRLERTYQLNVGGNADFLNMLERSRLVSKKISKTQAVTSVMGPPLPVGCVHVGPSDHVPWLTDRKVAMIRLEGAGFGGAPMSMEVRMEVWDSPNSAGVVLDALRWAQTFKDLDVGGPALVPSAYYMKSPPVQVCDDVARKRLDAMLSGTETMA